MQADLRIIILSIGLLIIAGIIIDGLWRRRKSATTKIKEFDELLISTNAQEEVSKSAPKNPPKVAPKLDKKLDTRLEAKPEIKPEVKLEPKLETKLENSTKINASFNSEIDPLFQVADVDELKEYKPKENNAALPEKIQENTAEMVSKKRLVSAPEKIKPKETAFEAPKKNIEVIAMSILSRNEKGFSGRALHALINKFKFIHSSQGLFQCRQDNKVDGKVLFSVASMTEPGTFDEDAMKNKNYPGILLFMQLPGSYSSEQTLDKMITVARQMACNLNGELCDSNRSHLTPKTLSEFRDKIKKFESA